jgi:hypothetical protein
VKLTLEVFCSHGLPSAFSLVTFFGERISKAANAICLKDYSSFLESKEAPAG